MFRFRTRWRQGKNRENCGCDNKKKTRFVSVLWIRVSLRRLGSGRCTVFIALLKYAPLHDSLRMARRHVSGKCWDRHVKRGARAPWPTRLFAIARRQVFCGAIRVIDRLPLSSAPILLNDDPTNEALVKDRTQKQEAVAQKRHQNGARSVRPPWECFIPDVQQTVLAADMRDASRRTKRSRGKRYHHYENTNARRAMVLTVVDQKWFMWMEHGSLGF